MNQLERNVTEAIKDAEASRTHTVMMGKFTAETLLREYRCAAAECRKWPLVMFAGMVLMMLFGLWLGQQVPPPCAAPRMEFKPTQLERAETEPPNMMTVSLVHRFRHQNKG